MRQVLRLGILLTGGLLLGCSRPAAPDAGGVSSAQAVGRALSPQAAAELAAGLANEECARLYQKKPFAPGLYPAILDGGTYRWGRLDPGGPGGMSARVSFQADGSRPNVEVYFSTDTILPSVQSRKQAPFGLRDR